MLRSILLSGLKFTYLNKNSVKKIICLFPTLMEKGMKWIKENFNKYEDFFKMLFFPIFKEAL